MENKIRKQRMELKKEQGKMAYWVKFTHPSPFFFFANLGANTNLLMDPACQFISSVARVISLGDTDVWSHATALSFTHAPASSVTAHWDPPISSVFELSLFRPDLQPRAHHICWG